MAHTLTDDERATLNEQSRDGAADAQAEWDALTDAERTALVEEARREEARYDAIDAYARDCARRDVEGWQTAAQRMAAGFEAWDGEDADYERWLDAITPARDEQDEEVA